MAPVFYFSTNRLPHGDFYRPAVAHNDIHTRLKTAGTSYPMDFMKM